LGVFIGLENDPECKDGTLIVSVVMNYQYNDLKDKDKEFSK